MKQTQLKIRLIPEESEGRSEAIVEAVEILPGLYIHRPLGVRGNFWNITHRSGFKVVGFLNRPRPRRYVMAAAIEELGALDWSGGLENMKPQDFKPYIEARSALQCRLDER